MAIIVSVPMKMGYNQPMVNGGDVLNGRYRLIQRAGTGGMSTVYKGQDLLLGRLVAVKVLHESLTGDEEFLERFQEEAHKAANLSQPNIVTVHDIGQDGRRYYIIMEFVEGWTLKEIVRKQRRTTKPLLSLERTLNFAIQICSGVGYAHRAGLVHCDVKSQNVLVARDETVKVTDFGIAQAMSETSIHRGDMIWGTPQYFSPEQAAGEKATPASDVYSIGVILFEMLTGRLPFEADSHAALAVKHIRDAPPHVQEINPNVPDQLDQIVDKVLSKEPSGRYRTAEQLGRVLDIYRLGSVEETGPILTKTADSQQAQKAINAALIIEQQDTLPPRFVIQDGELAVSTDEALPTSQASTVKEHEIEANRVIQSSEEEPSIDRTAIILAIIAVISLLGLIPLWYMVYQQYAG
jgi:serine/threonine-protein kinase